MTMPFELRPWADPEALGHDYSRAIKPQLEASFGSPDFTMPLPGEIGFEFFERDERVAWGSLVPNPNQTSYITRLGVFPGYEGCGIRSLVKDALCVVAFRTPGITCLTPKILLSNPEHCVRVLRAAAAGSIWRFSHVTMFPPAALHFVVLREAYLERAHLPTVWERFHEPCPSGAGA